LTATRSPALRPATSAADAGDGAGDLVAEDHRLLQPHSAEAAVEIVVQVRAADAAGLDPHLDIVRAERRQRHGFDPQVFRCVQHGGAHGILLVVLGRPLYSPPRPALSKESP
jgi:hypothetical protein